MSLSDGAADLLRIVRTRPPMTRAAIGDHTGWARVTVNGRLDELVGLGLVSTAGNDTGTRGRPAARFRFDPAAGSLLVADVGASAARLAHCDLDGRVLSQTEVVLDVRDGPDVVLDVVLAGVENLPTREDSHVWAAGMSLPGPIEHGSGRVVSPPIMLGWDGLAVPEVLEPALGVPVLIENDANVMAWGEQVLSRGADGFGRRDLMLVKVGTGVGVGIVSNGEIVRGAQGAAGDLGHTRVEPDDSRPVPLCHCGKLGCVESYAGGWAVARDLAEDGLDVGEVADVLTLMSRGEPHAISRIREAGRVLGLGLAHAVSLLNPSEVVVAGQLAAAGEHLLSGIRERVAHNSLPLATRDLQIRVSEHPHDAGVTGMVDLLTRWALEPANLPRVLERGAATTSG
ncbi:ROK family protein [Aeromicrobium sp. CTD01-1L150]|uniref:ROK family transcriptional regulator n=1 Tax=Aeromicrobium sp. CTD01-1L150 TaxID=3341830 RepID=UPI0035BEC9DA